MIKLAIDGMGGDFAPEPIIKGTLQALDKYSNIEITVFGDEEKMAPFLKEHPRLKIVHTTSFLDMGIEDPVFEYRNNKEHSLFKAMQFVADGHADAVVTAGPTQAVVVGGQLILRKMKGMRRAAIAPIIPSYDRQGKIMLDSGANVDLAPEHILNLAIYASIVAKEVLKRENPKIALINIGSEESKGRPQDRETYELLKNNENINFFGNLEPKEVFTTEADVLVTDGFTGNIVMKTMEGTAIGLGMVLEREIKSKLRNKIGYLFMKPALRAFKKSLDASEIGGALVIGLNHVLIKAHGSSNDFAFFNAIRQAKEMIEKDVINTVGNILNKKD
ncbi:MAG TPA: phosphate acyltransferase PlsX [Acholeplasma sp.]|nr:phosphate acyltransferase PlsX [Acholeplasma sp.]